MALIINRDFRLPDNQHRNEKHKKSGICVHHTVGGTAESTFNWWNSNPDKVGTAYIIDHDGTLMEVFDPESWAWEFGLDWPDPDRFNFERRFIGIELASEGGLIEKGGKFYCYDRISPRTEKPANEVFDAGQNYRGYRYFDRYEPAQKETLAELINHLCDRFQIPRLMLPDPMKYYGQEIKDFRGVIGHVNVRKDKTDPAPDSELWEMLKDRCNLTVAHTAHSQAGADTPKGMTYEQITQLFNHNVEELNKMYVPAGSMVKSLITELERKGRNTYIRLHDAEAGGHVIFYDFVEGDITLVGKLCTALGFKTVTEHRLEVRHA